MGSKSRDKLLGNFFLLTWSSVEHISDRTHAGLMQQPIMMIDGSKKKKRNHLAQL